MCKTCRFTRTRYLQFNYWTVTSTSTQPEPTIKSEEQTRYDFHIMFYFTCSPQHKTCLFFTGINNEATNTCTQPGRLSITQTGAYSYADRGNYWDLFRKKCIWLVISIQYRLVIKIMELKSQTYQNRLPIGFLDHERLTKSRGWKWYIVVTLTISSYYTWGVWIIGNIFVQRPYSTEIYLKE